MPVSLLLRAAAGISSTASNQQCSALPCRSELAPFLLHAAELRVTAFLRCHYFHGFLWIPKLHFPVSFLCDTKRCGLSLGPESTAIPHLLAASPLASYCCRQCLDTEKILNCSSSSPDAGKKSKRPFQRFIWEIILEQIIFFDPASL